MAKLRTSLLLVISMMFSENHAVILGPGTFILKNSEPCPDVSYASYINLNPSKINRTQHATTLDAYLDFDVEERSAVMHSNVAKWGDGGYKPNFYVLDDEVCKLIQIYGADTGRDILNMITGSSNCPIKKGKYDISNYIIEQNKLPSQKLYGKYKTTIKVDDRGVEVFCMIIYAEIISTL